ncbi:MAG: DUF86 domain-containing protein [Desulfobacterales bacterium]|nr:DUF86 domain-containing protein [Desulfobacterales bacterium]
MNNLPEEILIEKEYIEKTIDVMNEAIARNDQTYVELSAIGASLHHCYSGIENIIKRILKYKKISIRDSASSHKDLLDKAVNQGIITEELLNKLDKFRGFRHFFVHGYGILLNKDELLPLAMELPAIWNHFLSEIESFF